MVSALIVALIVCVLEDGMVLQEREMDTNKSASREVEEAHESAEVGMAGVETVALRQHHPASWVEAWVEDAPALGATGTCLPVRADSAEENVVLQVAG